MSDLSAHGFWKRGNTVISDIRIFNLNVVSNLHTMPRKAFAKAEKDKKYLYLQTCLEHIFSFTPMVYYADGISGAEALAIQKKLAALLRFKLKRG